MAQVRHQQEWWIELESFSARRSHPKVKAALKRDMRPVVKRDMHSVICLLS